MKIFQRLEKLTKTFSDNLDYYKDSKNNYNEHSTRIEFIDPFLELLGWDVSNKQGIAPQYREVIAENYSTKTDRPDYSLTLKGVTKFFVEAKKPSVEIQSLKDPAFQARRYGWNANHKIVVLTNFEYLIIYDSTIIPSENDIATTALYKKYHFTEYAEKFNEIQKLISKNSVYSGEFDNTFGNLSFSSDHQTQKVDEYFLSQINDWRIKISNSLYKKSDDFKDIEILNDKVQTFINQIVFLRICEDRNLPVYHKLIESSHDKNGLLQLLKESDKKYNSGLFEDNSILYNLDIDLISEIIESLYYPKSPYLFNIIEPNLLGKIYEQFLTRKFEIQQNEKIELVSKKGCADRSIVSTPIEIVKYIVEKTLSPLCKGKTPQEIFDIKIADIACGSGIFLEEALEYLVKYCENWYEENQKNYLVELSPENKKLPLKDKRQLLLSCIYGIDIDVHAVEVAKFSLLIKLIENETSPSVVDAVPILPNLDSNILFGNSLVESEKFDKDAIDVNDLISIAPFNWSKINNGNNFSAIIGNPPYVKTEDMHNLLSKLEFNYYIKNFKSSHKQFDKYFLFIEQAIKKTNENGRIGMIVPNKFFKLEAGKKLQELLAENSCIESIDDFGDSQIFENQTIYSCILILDKSSPNKFTYSRTTSLSNLWGGVNENFIELPATHLMSRPWKLTPDVDFIKYLEELNKYATPLSDYAEIFNGIQTSAERPLPIYWFSKNEIVCEDDYEITICKNGKNYKIEREILRPYFKPTKQNEKGLNTYSDLKTDKQIIFPYDDNGKLIAINIMEKNYPNTLNYLKAFYKELEPKQLNPNATRDVPNATSDTWYQYGRTQALTSFIGTPKLIVGVLSKEPMYAYDGDNMLIASGGTAGYCAIAEKKDSDYELEYIQAWLANPHTEKYLKMVGSDFENGFTARGTANLKTIPFIPLDLTKEKQKSLYDSIVEKTRRISSINLILRSKNDKRSVEIFNREKDELIKTIQKETDKIWNLDFLKEASK